MFDQLIDKAIWEAKLHLANQAGATSAIVTQAKWSGRGLSAVLAFRDWARVERLVAVARSGGYTVTIWTQDGNRVALSVDNGPSLLPADSKWKHLVTLGSDEVRLLAKGAYIGDTLFPEGDMRDEALGFSKPALDFKTKAIRRLVDFPLIGLKDSYSFWRSVLEWVDLEEELREEPWPLHLYKAENRRGEIALAYVRAVENQLGNQCEVDARDFTGRVFALMRDIVDSHEPTAQLRERVTAELDALEKEARQIQTIIQERVRAKKENGIPDGSVPDGYEVERFRGSLKDVSDEDFLELYLKQLVQPDNWVSMWATTVILLEAQRREKASKDPKKWKETLEDFGYSKHYRQWTSWAGRADEYPFIENTQAIVYLSDHLPLTRHFAYGSEKNRALAMRKLYSQAFIEGRDIRSLRKPTRRVPVIKNERR